MKRFILFAVGMAVSVSPATSRTGRAESPPVEGELQQPARLAPDEAGPPAPPLPKPITPDGLTLPPWLLPDAPTPDQAVVDPMIQLATANVPVPGRAAALYAQAEKRVAGAKTYGELTSILTLCEKGLADGPSEDLKQELSRLAAWAVNRRGELLIEEGDERAAFNDFSRAIGFDATCWAAFHNRAITFATYGEHEEALKDFATAIELNPEAVEPYRNRGELQFQLGQLAVAEADYSAALKRSPQDGDLRSRLGELYQRQGKTDLAAQEFEIALQLGVESAGTLAHRARQHAHSGRFDQAVIDFDAALRLDPYHAVTYQGVAWLLATCPDERFRDSPKALEAARRAQRFGRPDDPVMLDTLAAAHANAGDFAAAVQHARQAALLAAEPLRLEIERRVALYRQGQPFRDPVSR